MEATDPSATVKLDQGLVNRFSTSYRHIAYIQSKLGFVVNENLLKGPAVKRLYADGKAWLAGSKSPFSATGPS
jgi:hypothetical protein